jgi:hypothetical protein
MDAWNLRGFQKESLNLGRRKPKKGKRPVWRKEI